MTSIIVSYAFAVRMFLIMTKLSVYMVPIVITKVHVVGAFLSSAGNVMEFTIFILITKTLVISIFLDMRNIIMEVVSIINVFAQVIIVIFLVSG